MFLKKLLPEAVKQLKELFPNKDTQLWFQDEARIGQQGTISRMWADTGSCPRAIRQTNYKWTYLFGSVCPSTGQCHGWRMPYANTWIMNLYSKDFAAQLSKNTHALLVMDGAGWHSSKELRIPDNVSILLLPPYSPELNPAELIWRQLRQRKLSNRLYQIWLNRADTCHYRTLVSFPRRRLKTPVGESILLCRYLR